MSFADIRNEWNSFAINDLADSYYQEWTYEDRKLLEYTCQAGFLFSVVVVQWMTAIQVRSRKYSMVQKPLNNHVLNFALIFETVLAILIIYVPGNSEVNLKLKIFLAGYNKNISPPGSPAGPHVQPHLVVAWPGLLHSAGQLRGTEESHRQETQGLLGGQGDKILIFSSSI